MRTHATLAAVFCLAITSACKDELSITGIVVLDRGAPEPADASAGAGEPGPAVEPQQDPESEPGTEPQPQVEPQSPELRPDDPSLVPQSPPDPAAEPWPVALVACDADELAGVAWLTHASDHFLFHYLPGTVAEEDLAIIAERREEAYASIRVVLALAAEPMLEVYLSPSRVVAESRGLATGNAYPRDGLIEVIYTGAAGSYEVERHGHELTHVLAYSINADGRSPLPILDEGLAELLDQSGRDQHAAYAQQLAAYNETRTRLAQLDWNDVRGRNYGRAGSLVQMLVERHGMTGLLQVWRRTSLAWSQGCYRHAEYGCVDTPEAVEAVLGAALRAELDDSWEALQQAWLAAVKDALSHLTSKLTAGDKAEIRNLLALADRAIALDDAALYRSTMEGFYCDWGGEAIRTAIAQRSVQAFGSATSKLVALYDTGIVNFASATAMVLRHEDGLVALHTLQLEKLPAGWRVTWGPDWYE